MAFNKAKALQEAEKLVLQGKISQAIRQYFDIFERDPSDLILLNTIGDLYIRDKNASEGLKQFYRLAEAYVQDGFTLKAIAIYKKIAKLEPDAVDPLLKLVDLYQAQRLGREARELYYQVAELYKKKKQNDKVLETLRKVLQLDPENATARARLAAFCEEIGRKDEAMQVHVETAQLAFRRGDTAAAQAAMKKAQELGPDDPRIQLLRAREALALKRPEEVEAILSATPGLKDDPAGRLLLIDSYLAMQQLEKAETLVLEHFRANPADFSPLASFVSVCVQAGQFDTASRPLSALADELIEKGNTSSLMESLRLIWSKSPQHLPTLELIFRICDASRDENALPEILEALGRSYVQCEQFEKAEQAFQRLVDREPENDRYKVLLREVLQKQGKEFGKAHAAYRASSASALTRAEGVAAPGASAFRAVDREALVKEALENSELLAHYHLVRKAVAELDRILEIFPDETEIHRRLVGMCWREMPERAEQAALALANIYTQQGDEEGAKRFAQMAGGRAAPAAGAVPPQAARAPAMTPEPLPPLPAHPAGTAAGAIDLASEFSPAPFQEAETAATPHISATASAGVTFELPSPAEQEAPAPPPPQIPFDFSVAPAVGSPTTIARGAPLPPPIPPPREALPQPPRELPIDFTTRPSPVAPPALGGPLPPSIPPPREAPPPARELPIDLATRPSPVAPPAPGTSLPPSIPPPREAPPPRELPIDLATPPSPVASPALRAPLPPSISPPREAPPPPRELPIDLATPPLAVPPPLGTSLPPSISPPREAPPPRRELPIDLETPPLAVPPPLGTPLPPSIPSPREAPPLELPELPIDLVTLAASGEVEEIDLSEDWEIFQAQTAIASLALEIPPEAAEFNYEDSRTELIFYLENGFVEEAVKVVENLVRTLPGDPRVAELRALVEARTGMRVAEVPQKRPAETLKPAPLKAVAPPVQEAVELRGLASSYAAPKEPTAPASVPASPLSGLLEEIGEAPGAEPVPEDDPETHYNLGVAFREMSLLDEAIGEFQKVVKGAGLKPRPPNYLQACTLLATCFMDKGMAPIAVKWYCRALETPNLDEEVLLALQYDLGVAYEQAGDLPRALEKFAEVYGQNIDFRDVAEKIRAFQQKGS